MITTKGNILNQISCLRLVDKLTAELDKKEILRNQSPADVVYAWAGGMHPDYLNVEHTKLYTLVALIAQRRLSGEH